MRTLVGKIINNEFARGGILLTISSLVVNFLNYLFNVIAARALGPSGYGELATFFSYTIIIAVPLTVIATVLIQRISASKDPYLKALSYETFFLDLIKKWWFIGVAFLLLIPQTPKITNLSPASAYALIPFMLLSFLSTYYTSALQGLRLFSLFALLSFLGVITKLTGALFVMWGLGGIATIILFLFGSIIIGMGVGHLMIQSKIKDIKEVPHHGVDRSLISIIKNRQFITTTLSILAITLINNVDIIFVRKYFSSTDAGIYASWSLFAKIILYALSPLIQVSFVFFSSSQTKKSQQWTLSTSLVGLAVIGVAAFFVYQNYGNQVVNLFFGAKFVQVVPFMAQAALFGSFYTVIYYLNNFFLATNSKGSLILLASIPLYILLLYLAGTTVASIMWLNVFFTATVSVLYLSVFAVRILRRK